MQRLLQRPRSSLVSWATFYMYLQKLHKHLIVIGQYDACNVCPIVSSCMTLPDARNGFTFAKHWCFEAETAER